MRLSNSHSSLFLFHTQLVRPNNVFSLLEPKKQTLRAADREIDEANEIVRTHSRKFLVLGAWKGVEGKKIKTKRVECIQHRSATFVVACDLRPATCNFFFLSLYRVKSQSHLAYLTSLFLGTCLLTVAPLVATNGDGAAEPPPDISNSTSGQVARLQV